MSEPSEAEEAMVQLNVRCPAELRDWLKGEASHLPFIPGSGKKPDKRLSEYVRMVLEAHRRGGKYKPRLPPAAVVRAGEWMESLPPVVRWLVVTIGDALTRKIGDDDLADLAQVPFDRMELRKRKKTGKRRKA